MSEFVKDDGGPDEEARAVILPASSSPAPMVTVTATIPPEVREATAKVLETLRSVIGTEIPQGKKVSMHLRYVVCPEIDVSVESV